VRPFRLAILLLTLTLVAGCGSSSIYVPVTRPAELKLHGMDRIGIGLYFPTGVGDASQLTSGESLSSAFASTMAADGQYELVNLFLFEQEMEHALDERIFSTGNVAGIASAANVNGLIFGEIRQLKYDEDIIEADVHRFHKDDGKQVVRKGLLRMTVFMRVVNPETNTIIWEQSFAHEQKAETSAADSEPEAIDPVLLAMDAASALALDILDLTKEVKESVLVTFLNDSEYPDIEKAIKFARAGDWSQTVNIFTRLADESEGLPVGHKMHYNLGIAYQYSSNFRSAIANFERAMELEDSPRYQRAIDDCLKMEQSYLGVVNH
jgi:tetratricopeptide (TPR) repeat protein